MNGKSEGSWWSKYDTRTLTQSQLQMCFTWPPEYPLLLFCTAGSPSHCLLLYPFSRSPMQAYHLHTLPVLTSSGFHMPEVSQMNQSSLQAVLAFRRHLQAARLGSAKSTLLLRFHSAKLLCPVSFLGLCQSCCNSGLRPLALVAQFKMLCH